MVVAKKTAVNPRLRARSADAEIAIQQRRTKAWKHRALQAEAVLDFEKKSRDAWKERAEDAEQMAKERLAALDRLNEKLGEVEDALADAKEQIEQDDEIDFAGKASEIDFWVEECDYHRNKRLADWANDARYRATEARKKQVTPDGG